MSSVSLKWKWKTRGSSPSMAARSTRQDETLSLSEDLTCAICCDLFSDPVMLGCMHHFCKPCITTYWRGITGPAVCPQCRREFPKKQFQTNYLVAGLVEKVRASSSSGSVRNLQVRCMLYLDKQLSPQGLVIPWEVLPWHSLFQQKPYCSVWYYYIM